MAHSSSYECIVIGGGPAGATVAAILADFGHRVLLLEAERFPRHHIGESLMPQTYHVFKRLGVLDELQRSAAPRKESVQFVSSSGKESQPYYFTDRDPGPWSITWQVRRDEFDKLMLDNARRKGAEIQEGVRVTEVLFDGDRAVGVRARADGRDGELTAGVVVDASGQTGILSRQLGIRQADPALRNAAMYAYFAGAYRDTGRNAGGTIIIHTEDRNGWFWSIPLSRDLTSVGLVAPPEVLFTGRGDNPLPIFESEIARCAAMARRLSKARRASDMYVTRDFSYSCTRVAGDGWVLVGDAFGFLDPIYSSGVMLALKSGEFAADCIHEALQADDLSGARLGAFEPRLVAGMHLLRQLVHAFYDRRFSFAAFTKAFPQYKDHLVRLLIGDVFNNEVGVVFDEMGEWVDYPEPPT